MRTNPWLLSFFRPARFRVPSSFLFEYARMRTQLTTMPIKRTSVLNEERRRSIVDFVNQNGRALVRELAKRYSSSEITIRRDLEMLHNRGLLYRTHGGALPIRAGTESDRNLTEREMQHPREKAAHRSRCRQDGAARVNRSCLIRAARPRPIARALREFQHLTVITNAINIASELVGQRPRRHPDRRNAARQLVFAGRTHRRREPAPPESRHRLSWCGRLRHPDRGLDAQPAGGATESPDGTDRGAGHRRVRFQ